MAGHLVKKPAPAKGEVVITLCCGVLMIADAVMGPGQYTLSGIDCDQTIANDPNPAEHVIVVCDPLPQCGRCLQEYKPTDNYCWSCGKKLK